MLLSVVCALACACLSWPLCSPSSSQESPGVPDPLCLGTGWQAHTDWIPRASSWEQTPTDTGWQQVSSLHVSKSKLPLSSCPCSTFPIGFPQIPENFAYTGEKHSQLCCLSLLYSVLCFISVLDTWQMTVEIQIAKLFSRWKESRGAFWPALAFEALGIFIILPHFHNWLLRDKLAFGCHGVLDITSTEIHTLLQLI